jgi:hypothetical protein
MITGSMEHWQVPPIRSMSSIFGPYIPNEVVEKSTKKVKCIPVNLRKVSTKKRK